MVMCPGSVGYKVIRIDVSRVVAHPLCMDFVTTAAAIDGLCRSSGC